MQLFQGTTVTDTTETVLTFVPEKAQKDQVVFRFSRKFGLLTADDFSGEPYRIKVDDLGLDEEELDVVESAKKEDFQLGVILPCRQEDSAVRGMGGTVRRGEDAFRNAVRKEAHIEDTARLSYRQRRVARNRTARIRGTTKQETKL